ncbi:TGS domain-containing protein [Cupriavidus consociatus]|uniref:TGS domain-containing protein n=1 Tax=Cupriavidus consociatus TaxID=2821357 RepID=UPI001AE1B97C|nr:MULTISPECIES: TGS domain-containing protein [unclassified Cupriavidus]MBP0625026.1 TGS domain-containing protein [Cupriavidus sp. LEh25]MDK2661761.1 TGS domain-containing protein [Cupriavidus sp. LEh21]
MPANLTPEYKQAEQAYRMARQPREQLDCLKEMLRVIPKHKGTERLQADIKSRIRELTQESAAHGKAAHRGPSHAVHPEGAAQLCLIGPSGTGKSSLHARLTGSGSESGAYPHPTQLPVPAMLPFEDIAFQLVDLPPVSAEFMQPGLTDIVRVTDGVLLVVDLSAPDCTEQLALILRRLAEARINLLERWPGQAGSPAASAAAGLFSAHLPALLLANKADLANPDDAAVLEDLLGVHFPALATSATRGQGLAEIGPFLFRALSIVRVYTKAPGKPVDQSRPFTMRRGDTVLDVALRVHPDLARTFKFARIWGSGKFSGQQVGADHPVADRDVVELHA